MGVFQTIARRVVFPVAFAPVALVWDVGTMAKYGFGYGLKNLGKDSISFIGAAAFLGFYGAAEAPNYNNMTRDSAQNAYNISRQAQSIPGWVAQTFTHAFNERYDPSANPALVAEVQKLYNSQHAQPARQFASWTSGWVGKAIDADMWLLRKAASSIAALAGEGYGRAYRASDAAPVGKYKVQLADTGKDPSRPDYSRGVRVDAKLLQVQHVDAKIG